MDEAEERQQRNKGLKPLKERVGNRAELVAAIQAVASGGSVIDPKIVEDLVTLHYGAATSGLHDLTPQPA